jgi:group I intron endonuclease
MRSLLMSLFASSSFFNILNSLLFLKIYLNPIKDRDNKIIFNDNNKKSGIYMLTNKINNKRYIGSAIDLNKRISRYFQKSYLLKNKNFLIVKAIKKYGISNFYISILEYTNPLVSDLLKQEQYWLDQIRPEYNILKIAGNSLGYKHSELVKFKISQKRLGVKMEEITKERISRSLKVSKLVGHKHSIDTKKKLSIIASMRKFDPNKGLYITIKDITTGIIKSYKSIREAARDRIPDYKGIWIRPQNCNKSVLFRNRYEISLISKDCNSKI